jgi:uncharacterized membrane protein YqjE
MDQSAPKISITMRFAAGFLGLLAALAPVAMFLMPEMRADWSSARVVASIVLSLAMAYWFLRTAITGRSAVREKRRGQ